MAFQPPYPPLQDGPDRPTIAVLDGHRDQVRRPPRPGRLRLDHGLHPDVHGPALERLHPIVQVEDLPLGEDDQHLPPPLHEVDGEPLRRLVLAPTFHGEGPEALEPPAGDPESLAERLPVHHEEEPPPAPAGEVEADLEVLLVGVVGGEDQAHPRRQSAQHGQVRRPDADPVPPGQIEPQEGLHDPDHPAPGLRRSEVGRSGHGSPPDDGQPPEEGRASNRVRSPSTFTKSTGLVRCVSKPASLASWMSDSCP